MTADEIIQLLDLEPHPEGGYFRETHRDVVTLDNGRSCATAIYFLLKKGQASHWHTVDATEIWHWYSGDPLALRIAAPDSQAERVLLGPDLSAGQFPQRIVPNGHWQSAETLGDFTLVGCTVSPAFDSDGFVLAEQGFKPGRHR